MDKAIDRRQTAIIGTIAAKLREARELCKHEQNQAAELLGVDAQELRKFESGIDVKEIPLWLIATASEVYDVSIDYLFGFTDDWEICQETRKERDFLAVLERLHIQAKSETITKQICLESAIKELANAVSTLAPAIQTIDDGFMRFWELNQDFTDMKAGAMIINKVDSANKLAAEAVRKLIRVKALSSENLSSIRAGK